MNPWKDFVQTRIQATVEKASERIMALIPMETQMKVMGGAMALAQKGTAALDELKSAAAPYVEKSVEFRASVRRPRLLGPAVEERTPWLTNAFLSAASNIQEPFLAGRGIRVKTWNDSGVEVAFPNWFLNNDETGSVHSGALTVLAETAARLFWERAMDPRLLQLELGELHVRFFKPCDGPARACVLVSESEREKMLRDLRVQCLGTTDASAGIDAQMVDDAGDSAEALFSRVGSQEIEVRVLDSKDQLVATVHTTWKIRLQKTLQSSLVGGN